MITNIFKGFYPQKTLGRFRVYVPHDFGTKEVAPHNISEINLREVYPETIKRDRYVFAHDTVVNELESGMTTLNIKQI